MIKALRIDHRLVHGQVAFTWTHFLGATRIIVIDDKAAGKLKDSSKLKSARWTVNIFLLSPFSDSLLFIEYRLQKVNVMRVVRR